MGTPRAWIGITSLAVVAGLIGVVLGFPLADPIAGLAITAAIVWIVVRNAAPQIFLRILDGVDAGVTEMIAHAARHVADVLAIHDVRARWLGHRLFVDATVNVHTSAMVAEAATIAAKVQDEMGQHLPHLGDVRVLALPAGGPS